ncbi:MAG: hypothetical protein WDA13_03665 [Candidatus Shapirobacteria bacterium]
MKQVEHKIMSIVLVIAAMVVLFSSLSPIKAGATSYSSDDEKRISIDKKLRSIYDSEYQDNIASSQKVFYEEDLIEFKIKVENTGDTVLKNIKVTDNLPPFLKLVFHPGTFDETNNKVEWTIEELAAGEVKDYLIRAKIDKSKDVKTLTKETNVAGVCVDKICDRDDASYFIGDGVSIPNTGDAGLLIKTSIVLSLTGAGFLFRKYARGY